MTAESSREPEDPLKGISEDFQDYERDLLGEAIARIQRDIPEKATVGEAVEEMRRAMFEEDDATEVLFRIAILQNHGGGYIRSHLEELADREPPDLHVKYTSAIPPMSEEALNLMMYLGEEIDKRLPPGLSEAEREAHVVELLSEDEELAELAFRLEQLTTRDDGA
jgi:hypothetical protein